MTTLHQDARAPAAWRYLPWVLLWGLAPAPLWIWAAMAFIMR
jgi:hypothetical protein